MGQVLSPSMMKSIGRIIAVIPVLCTVASDPMAEDKVVSRVNVYADNDHTTVISPMIIVQKDIFDTSTLNVQYVADIESCASVDVVSTASPVSSKKGYQETRHNISANVLHRMGLTTVGAGYYYSTENDYTSNAISASFSQDLFQRNFTIDSSLSYRWDDVGRVKDQFFSKRLNGLSTTLSLTQVLSPRIIGQFVYFLEYLDGYQSSPYRVVPVADFSVPETHPPRRIRHSFTGRLKEALSDRWSLEQSLRFYTDSWGVDAETILLQLYYQFSDPLSARLTYRFYTQDKADFYKESYQSLQEFVSRDRELATFHSHLVGPQIILELNDFWIFSKADLDLKVEYFTINYEDFALLKHRQGLLFGTGFSLLY